MIAAKQEQLKERLGTLAELFGHLTAASGDLASNIEVSLVSSEFPNREGFLKDLIAKMTGSDKLPQIEEIERVWYELLNEITQQGVVSRFTADVATPSGEIASREVVRIGAFNIVDADGNYLSYGNEKLAELPRQPGGGSVAKAATLADATGGLNPFGIDPTGPTGGSFLAAIIDTPTIEERWHQGGYVGYAITAVGAFAFLLAIVRVIMLTMMGAAVNSQLKSSEANVPQCCFMADCLWPATCLRFWVITTTQTTGARDACGTGFAYKHCQELWQNPRHSWCRPNDRNR